MIFVFSYFQKLEAVGFAGLSKVEIQKGISCTIFNKLRHHIGQEIRRVLPGQSGEIAAALIIGDRSGITTEVGIASFGRVIAHILAISGLHLSLVAGLFFCISKGVDNVNLPCAAFPLKKIAEVCDNWNIFFA